MRSAAHHSVLDVVEAAFQRLASGPRPLTLDGGAVGCGLPVGALRLTDVRDVLLRQPPVALRDAIWRELVRRARKVEDGDAWSLAALGVMLPGLRKISRTTAGLSAEDHEEVEAEIVTAFLTELSSVDLQVDRLPYRMWWAAFRRARTVMRQRVTAVRELVAEPADGRPAVTAVLRHPDFALARMRSADVITEVEEDLIGRTRLEGESLTDAAQRLGISYQACKQRRGRAERRILQCLACGPLPGALRRTGAGDAGPAPATRRSREFAAPAELAA